MTLYIEARPHEADSEEKAREFAGVLRLLARAAETWAGHLEADRRGDSDFAAKLEKYYWQQVADLPTWARRW